VINPPEKMNLSICVEDGIYNVYMCRTCIAIQSHLSTSDYEEGFPEGFIVDLIENNTTIEDVTPEIFLDRISNEK
jgi:hypothetical protein